MKYKILLILITSVSITKAQDYDFKNYKYRVNGYKALSFNSSINAGLNSSFNVDYSQKGGGMELDGFYSRFKNTEKHIKNISGGLKVDGNLSKMTGNNLRNFNLSDIQLNNDDYYYRGNLFLVSRLSIEGGYNSRTADNPQPVKKERNYDVHGQYEIGLGKGRLEYISDPVMANFILKDMKNKGIINTYSSEQVESFGKKISQILSIRMIDYRFRMIDQIAMLDSFLSKEITNQKSNALYFTTLYDNWLYANRFQRFAGKRHEFLVGDKALNYNYHQEFDSNATQNRNNFFNTAYLAYQYSSEIPLKLTLQKGRTFRVELRRSNSIEDNNSQSYSYKYYHANLYFSEGIGWYPNTRTYLHSGMIVQANYQFKQGLEGPGSKKRYSSDILGAATGPYANLYYFFSPRFRLNASGSIRLNYNKYLAYNMEPDFYISCSVYAGIAYVLF